MRVVKPMSDLRDEAKDISNLALRLELLDKLAVAQAQRASGDRGRTVSQLVKGLKKKIRETA